ncbi:hypothetical protein [Pontixanthobacter sp.]
MADYLSFGEIMLRLKTPGHERFFRHPHSKRLLAAVKPMLRSR